MSAIYTLEFVHDGGAKFSFVFTDAALAERAINEAQEHGFRCREWCQCPTADAGTVNRFPEICREAIEEHTAFLRDEDEANAPTGHEEEV